MNQPPPTTTAPASSSEAGAPSRTTGRRRRLWDVAPPDAPVRRPTPIANPLVENLITLPDGTITAEYIINDCRHRGLLTRKTAQVQLLAATRTSAVVRGRYLVDAALSTAADRSLHLTLTAPCMSDMNDAIQWIDRVIETGSTYSTGPVQPAADAATPTAVKDADGTVSLSIPVPISRSVAESRRFPLIASLLGPDDAYRKHVEAQTGAIIDLRHQHRPIAVQLAFEIKAKTTTAVNDAKILLGDLIQTVKQACDAATPPPPPPPPKTTPAPPPVRAAYPAPYPPYMPPMYGVPHPYHHPGMAATPYYYAYGGAYGAAPVSNENQFPDRPETKKAAAVVVEATAAKRARLPAVEDETEFERFKKQMTTETMTRAPTLSSRPSAAAAAITDDEAQRIMKEHLDL